VPSLTLERFPALRRLGIDNAWATVDELEPLLRSPLGAQLEAVTIAFSRYDHGDGMRLLAIPIADVTVTEGPWLFRLAGGALSVRYRVPHRAPADVLAHPEVRRYVVGEAPEVGEGAC
jgi:hypothetical protein